MTARVECKNIGKGHCDSLTVEEAVLAAQLLVIFCMVCVQMDVLVFSPTFGGIQVATKFYIVFISELTKHDNYSELRLRFPILYSLKAQGHIFHTLITIVGKLGQNSKISSQLMYVESDGSTHPSCLHTVFLVEYSPS